LIRIAIGRLQHSPRPDGGRLTGFAAKAHLGEVRAFHLIAGLVVSAALAACRGRPPVVEPPRKADEAPVVTDIPAGATAWWTVQGVIAHRIVALPGGDLVVLGQRRPAGEVEPARRSVAWVAVHGRDGALRWSRSHAGAWELAERAALHDDGSIAVQGRSVAPERADVTWVRAFAADGTLHTAQELLAESRPLGIAWAGAAIEVLGMAPDGSHLTLGRLDPGAETAVSRTEIDVPWNAAPQLVAAGEAQRVADGRWRLWTNETTAQTIELEFQSGRSGVLLIEASEGEDEAAEDGFAGRGQAIPRLGPAVTIASAGGAFVARPRLPTADSDARLEVGWSVDPEATLAFIESQPVDPLELPELPLTAEDEAFAAWRWHGLAAGEDAWSEALDQRPVGARALMRWLVEEGVCSGFPGEQACNEASTYLGEPGWGTDVSDACQRRDRLDEGLDRLTRDDVEALAEHWASVLAQLEVPSDDRSFEQRARILDRIRELGAAPVVGRAMIAEDPDDAALLGVALLADDGSDAALAVLEAFEATLWEERSGCTLAREAREALAAAGRALPVRVVDRRDACELVFALCVLDDATLWEAALPPGRGRTVMLCEPGYPGPGEELGTLDEACEAGTSRGIELSSMTDEAVATCDGRTAELDEAYDPTGNCGVAVTVDARTITLKKDRDGRHFIAELEVSRSSESH
jgi:hypothetical protein